VLATEQQRLEAEKLQAQRLLDAAELHARDIESTELTPVYAALATWEPALGKLRARLIAQPAAEGRRGARNANPDPVFRGQGSHNDNLVELEGLEPSTSAMPWRRSPS
jgi:hypothetical protein